MVCLSRMDGSRLLAFPESFLQPMGFAGTVDHMGLSGGAIQKRRGQIWVTKDLSPISNAHIRGDD